MYTSFLFTVNLSVKAVENLLLKFMKISLELLRVDFVVSRGIICVFQTAKKKNTSFN